MQRETSIPVASRDIVAADHAGSTSSIERKKERDDAAVAPLLSVSNEINQNGAHRVIGYRPYANRLPVEKMNGESTDGDDRIDSPITSDPTPPTTVARSDSRVPSLLDEAYGPVGRPSPFFAGDIVPSDGGLDATALPLVARDLSPTNEIAKDDDLKKG